MNETTENTQATMAANIQDALLCAGRLEKLGLNLISAVSALDAVYEFYYDREQEDASERDGDLMAIIHTVARAVDDTYTEYDSGVARIQRKLEEEVEFQNWHEEETA